MLREQDAPTAKITDSNTERSVARKGHTPLQRFMAGATGLVLASSLAACGENTNATPENTSTPPTASETAQPTITASPEVTQSPSEIPKPSEVITDPSTSPEDYVTGGIFEYLDSTTQETIESLHQMDTPTFRQLPQEQQTAFADYVVYNSSPYVDSWLREAGINLSYTRNPQGAQESKDNSMYIYILATHLVEKKEKSDGGSVWTLNNELGQKLLAGANVSVGDIPTTWDNEMAALNSSTIWNIAGIDKFIDTVTAETVNPDGTISYTASNEAGETKDGILVPVTVNSLTGDGAQFTTFLYK